MMAQTGHQVLQSNISYGKKTGRESSKTHSTTLERLGKGQAKTKHTHKKKAQWTFIGSIVLEVQTAVSALRCAGRV